MVQGRATAAAQRTPPGRGSPQGARSSSPCAPPRMWTLPPSPGSARRSAPRPRRPPPRPRMWLARSSLAPLLRLEEVLSLLDDEAQARPLRLHLDVHGQVLGGDVLRLLGLDLRLLCLDFGHLLQLA